MKKYVNIIGKIITLLSLIFIVVAVYKLGFDTSVISNIPIFVVLVFVSALLLCCSTYMLGYAWKIWLSYFTENKICTFDAQRVYAKANIGKYLPGNVMHYVERNIFAAKLGLDQNAVALSSIFEIIDMVMAAFFVAICFSMDNFKRALYKVADIKEIIVIGAGIVVCIVVIAIFFRKKICFLIQKYFKKNFLKHFIWCMPIYILALVLGGVIMVALYWYMGNSITMSVCFNMISCYIISWVIGFIVPGAPGGIGVREFVLVFLLQNRVGQNTILTMAVIHRLITIIGDLFAYGVAICIKYDLKAERFER